MEISVLLLAAGSGKRMEQSVPKQFLLLGGKPLIFHTLERLDSIKTITRIVIVSLPTYSQKLKEMISKRRLQKEILVVDGGQSRQESVRIGLNYISTPLVLIHEAARPLLKRRDFEELIVSANENVTYGLPIPFTVLGTSEGVVSAIYDRDTLFNVQLPQKFNTETLKQAHQIAFNQNYTFTEDASLLFQCVGVKSSVIPGQQYNIKITYPTDLIVAEKLYKSFILEDN